MLMYEVDFDLLPDVLLELQERIPALEYDLHKLVQTPDATDLLASAFRHMHTIKGDFSYCHATPIAEFVHQLESVLQSMRSRIFDCSALVAEALLQSMDLMQDMLDDLVQTRKFDLRPRDALMPLLEQLAQASNQEMADQAARQVLLKAHAVWAGELESETAPAVSNDVSAAIALGEQLAAALELRQPAWHGRCAFQLDVVKAINRHYLQPVNEAQLHIAVCWHDVGLLALPDALLLQPPTPNQLPWQQYASHPERAASWLLSMDPNCQEAARIIRQHHLWVNGVGIASPHCPMPPHAGAQMLACADLLFDYGHGLHGEEFRRALLRTLFEVNGGLDARFDAQLINAFDAMARNYQAPASTA